MVDKSNFRLNHTGRLAPYGLRCSLSSSHLAHYCQQYFSSSVEVCWSLYFTLLVACLRYFNVHYYL